MKLLLERLTQKMNSIRIFGGSLKLLDELIDNLTCPGLKNINKNVYLGTIVPIKTPFGNVGFETDLIDTRLIISILSKAQISRMTNPLSLLF